MKRILATSIASATLFAFAPSALADFSAEVGIYSDYRDKGISWTDGKPALQAEIEYSHDTGIYLGAWASNVDYGEGEDAKVEGNFYLGYEFEASDDIALYAEAMRLIYIGDSDYNYNEFTLGINLFENTDFSVIYTNDYSGSELANYAFVLSQDFPFADVYNLNLSVYRQQNESTDLGGGLWDEERNYYNGAEISLSREWQGFDFTLTGSTNSIKTEVENSKSALVFSISKAWDW